MLDLSLVILNYKQKGLVRQCLKGILSAQPRLKYEIIVVDNNSQDGCLAAVKQLFTPGQAEAALPESLFKKLESPPPALITIPSATNGGFALGNNLGLKRARGKYALILNPDIAVVPGVLEKMFLFMEKNPSVGIIGPKLINPDGSVQYSCRRFPSWWMPLYRRSFLGKLPIAKRGLEYYLMMDFDHNQTAPVDWLFGACLMIRRSVLEKIGPFDERFFMYFEDLDWCRRCWQADCQVYYFAAAELVHYHQRLSAERSGILGLFKKAGRIHLTSGLKYFAKYLGAPLPPRSN